MGDGFANGVIRLENEPRAVFYAGQEITGSVLFELSQPLRFSVLTLTILGEANVLWTEDQKEEYNGVVRHRLVKYIGYEEYFKYTEFLAGGQGKTKLPKGSRAFPFKYRIPFSAPSSFTGEKGSVRYSITACLVNSDPTMMNEELLKEFKVIAPMDLNVGPTNVKCPIEMEFEEVYGCDCICSPEPMTIKIRLPVTGYCPGQVIPVSVHIDNESSTEITKIVFQLLSKERYRSKQPVAEYIPAEKVLTTYKSGAIMGKSKRKFTYDLTVPDMIPPNLENCSIIDIGYFFRIRIKLSGCNSDLKDESDIYLGLVPILETIEGEYVHPMAHCLPIIRLPDLSKEYEIVAPVNPAFVEPTNTADSPPNNNYNINAPYPSQNSPYPPENSPYPPENTPYQSKISPYPTTKAPYPPENTPVQSKISPYPTPKAPYPSENSPYPPENSPYQSKISPCPTPKAPYPSENSPYPPENSPYQSNISPYPTPKAPLPYQNSPYPSENTPYQSQSSPHPVESQSYQNKTAPYPIETKTDDPTTAAKPNPLGDYLIGFKTPESVPTQPHPNDSAVSPPYPLFNNMPGSGPPYPTNIMPGPQFPTPERDLRIYLPPVSPRVEPSAPPPSS